uniref:Uncharacterized protein n=1 Tax=Cucumis melo TaxID=3656 RepID=A0A9I9E4Y6_CUCME
REREKKEKEETLVATRRRRLPPDAERHIPPETAVGCHGRLAEQFSQVAPSLRPIQLALQPPECGSRTTCSACTPSPKPTRPASPFATRSRTVRSRQPSREASSRRVAEQQRPSIVNRTPPAVESPSPRFDRRPNPKLTRVRSLARAPLHARAPAPSLLVEPARPTCAVSRAVSEPIPAFKSSRNVLDRVTLECRINSVGAQALQPQPWVSRLKTCAAWGSVLLLLGRANLQSRTHMDVLRDHHLYDTDMMERPDGVAPTYDCVGKLGRKVSFTNKISHITLAKGTSGKKNTHKADYILHPQALFYFTK